MYSLQNVKLSDLYDAIGDFLEKNGDMNVVSIATHCGKNVVEKPDATMKRFSINLMPLDNKTYDPDLEQEVPVYYETENARIARMPKSLEQYSER